MDVSGIYFCDGTYIGSGDSFDISMVNQNFKIKTIDNEVAFNIAYLLNKGNAVDSNAVRKIVSENERFCKYFYEAAFYNRKRKIYEKQGNWIKHDLMETLFEIAREKALHAREKLRNSKQKS